MSYQFKLPDVGEGVHEGEIVKWYVKAGEQVQEDDLLVEIMTDKTTVEISSPISGKVTAIHYEEGSTVQVGEVIIEFEEGVSVEAEVQPPDVSSHRLIEEAPLLKPPEIVEIKEESSPIEELIDNAVKSVDIFSPPENLGSMYEIESVSEAVETSQEIIKALPGTRKLAKELGIDLSLLSGSGKEGRITNEDVIKASKRDIPLSSEGLSSEKARVITHTPVKPPFFAAGEEEGLFQPLTGLRKKIAENMELSHRYVPRAVHFDELDLTRLTALRKSMKESAAKRGVKLTYLPYFLKAASIALQEYPQVNALFDEERRGVIRLHKVNIGIAADTPKGLMVPVIKHVPSKSLIELAAEIEQLAEDARRGGISSDSLKGGGFTITNIGSIGGMLSVPVVYHPQTAILGMHSITPRPVVREGEIVIRDIMYISLAFDHRIIDGAEGARFASRIKQLLEEPAEMMLLMG